MIVQVHLILVLQNNRYKYKKLLKKSTQYTIVISVQFALKYFFI